MVLLLRELCLSSLRENSRRVQVSLLQGLLRNPLRVHRGAVLQVKISWRPWFLFQAVKCRRGQEHHFHHRPQHHQAQIVSCHQRKGKRSRRIRKRKQRMKRRALCKFRNQNPRRQKAVVLTEKRKGRGINNSAFPHVHFTHPPFSLHVALYIVLILRFHRQ